MGAIAAPAPGSAARGALPALARLAGGQMSPGLGSQFSQQELRGQGRHMDTWAWPVTELCSYSHAAQLLFSALPPAIPSKNPPPHTHKHTFPEQLLCAKQRPSVTMVYPTVRNTYMLQQTRHTAMI